MRRFFAACVCVLLACGARANGTTYDASGSDNIRYLLHRAADELKIQVLGAGVDGPDQVLFIALKIRGETGSYFIPSEPGKTGAAVWLPFPADTLIVAHTSQGRRTASIRHWNKTQWSPLEETPSPITIEAAPAQLTLHIPKKLWGSSTQIALALYLKDLAADGGRGRLYGAEDKTAASGTGERVIHHYLIMEANPNGTQFLRAGRLSPRAPKTRIFQRPLHFLAEEKKFDGFEEQKLETLKSMGFTHAWLAGAVSPTAEWSGELQAFIEQLHALGLKVLLDFTPEQETAQNPSNEKLTLQKGADHTLAAWQKMGVDGFGVTTTNAKEPESWRQIIAQARKRHPEAYFILEAKNEVEKDDIAAWLDAGFDALDTSATHQLLHALYEKETSANDLDPKLRQPFIEDHTLESMELSSEEISHKNPSRALIPLLFGLSRGPVILTQNQEFEMSVEANDFYHRLLTALNQPAFREGDFLPLNPDNRENPHYGRVDNGESGRWLYSYLRYDVSTGQRLLVMVNLHPREALHDLRVRFTRPAMQFLGWDNIVGSKSVPVMARDILGDVPSQSAEITTTPAEMDSPGLPIKELPPLSAAYYELRRP